MSPPSCNCARAKRFRRRGSTPTRPPSSLKVAVLYPQSEWAAKAQPGRTILRTPRKTRAIAVYRALIEQYPQSQAAEQARARLTALAP